MTPIPKAYEYWGSLHSVLPLRHFMSWDLELCSTANSNINLSLKSLPLSCPSIFTCKICSRSWKFKTTFSQWGLHSPSWLNKISQLPNLAPRLAQDVRMGGLEAQLRTHRLPKIAFLLQTALQAAKRHWIQERIRDQIPIQVQEMWTSWFESPLRVR
jgi:hypothetical protein